MQARAQLGVPVFVCKNSFEVLKLASEAKSVPTDNCD